MKRYIKSSSIFAMAIEKDKLEQRMRSWSDLIVEHLAKCAMYGDTLPGNKYNHWIEHELATWLSDTNDSICKHNNKKLKPSQYESILFGWLSDSPADARANLHDLQIHNKKHSNNYPYVEVDSDMISRMTEISKRILATFIPLLASKNDLSKKDIEDKLHEILDPICKNLNKE